MSNNFTKYSGKGGGNLVAKEKNASKNKAKWRQSSEEAVGRSGNKIQGLTQG